jgi:ubiquinone/menaquinone biosynthesis C-methylase UbiE
MDWSAYATKYDLMAESNPAYQDLYKLFDQHLCCLDLGGQDSILELGSGTGNFTLKLASLFPNNAITATDANARMLELASQKLNHAGFPHVNFTTGDFSDVLSARKDLGLIIAVHASYCSDTPQQLLNQIYRSLRPGGHLFVIDLGRLLDVPEWRKYILQHLIQTKGLLSALTTLFKGRIVVKSNQHIRRRQLDGKYWLHTSREFEQALGESGLRIVKSGLCYRDYSDWALATRPLL